MPATWYEKLIADKPDILFILAGTTSFDTF